ncbi:MAG: hypothetical protein HC866_23710 [Leptolyngbyaceae cyanobacterium RU_5_1]|nr:hypothetical protein [Leptolyngbyaceae cyanobacterium RU_5_1]
MGCNTRHTEMTQAGWDFLLKNPPDPSLEYLWRSNPDLIIGAATFDQNGFLVSVLTPQMSSQFEWLQATFGAVCFKSVLTTVLQLRGFQHLIIWGGTCNILLIKHSKHYLGLLLHQDTPEIVMNAILKTFTYLT